MWFAIMRGMVWRLRRLFSAGTVDASWADQQGIVLQN